jgi:hypothetical protein
LLKEWFSRRKGKVQPISLIERVNRSVSPELEGITLARLVGDGPNRHLEALLNLREYQLTLRNTSTINLQNVEIQFEFPVEDIEAWASRPSLSKTALVLIDSVASEPWKKSFRWRIPHLPAGDSVEFTFRAVNPPSESYEAALYNSDLVIVERVVGEPVPKTKHFSTGLSLFLVGALLAGGIVILLWFTGSLVSSSGEKFINVKEGGCDLRVISIYDHYGERLKSPWRIKDRIFNTGTQSCVVQSVQVNPKGPFTIGPGDVFDREWIIEYPPKLISTDLSVGLTNTTLKKIPIQIYAEQ